MKKVYENLTEFSSKLLDFRNTLNISGKSTAQIFFGCRFRNGLPHLPEANDLEVENAKVCANKRKQLMEQKEHIVQGDGKGNN